MDEIVRPPPGGRTEDAATLPNLPGAAARLDVSEKPCLGAGVGDGVRDGGGDGEKSSISSIGDGGASGGLVAFRLRPAFLPSFGFGSLPPCMSLDGRFLQPLDIGNPYRDLSGTRPSRAQSLYRFTISLTGVGAGDFPVSPCQALLIPDRLSNNASPLAIASSVSPGFAFE
jgi:hypothetical protein